MADIVQYKQAFWCFEQAHGDVGPNIRAAVAKAALALQYNNPEVLFATSAGGYNPSEDIELSLVIPADVDAETYKERVAEVLQTEGVEYPSTLECQTWFYELTEEDVDRVRKSTFISNLAEARQSVEQLVNLPLQDVLPSTGTYAEDLAKLLVKDGDNSSDTLNPAAAPAAGVEPGDIPPSEVLQSFSVDTLTYERLKGLRGDAIAKEFERVRKSVGDLANATKTNIAVGIMVVGGIVTVGKAMFAAYSAISAAGSITTMVSGLIASVGGLGPFIGVVAAIAAIIALAWILAKDAVNELMLINGLTTEIVMARPEDSIWSGERYGVTVNIPAAPDRFKLQKPMAYPGGFYFYRKKRVFGKPLGFYGSTLGTAFRIPSSPVASSFSIGLTCPLTSLGGTNLIYAMKGADAKKAADALTVRNGPGKATMTVHLDNAFTCTVSRAASGGTINYAIATVSTGN